jgi:hypothetical protein
LVILPTLISNLEIDGVSSTTFLAGAGPFCFFAFCSVFYSPVAGASPLLSSFGFCYYFLSPPAYFLSPPASSGFLPDALAAFCSFYQAALAIAFNCDLVGSGAFSFGKLTKRPSD